MLSPALRLTCFAPLLAGAVLLGGCQAERAIVSPVEPEWSYQDGSEQLSNNDAWEKMIPASALLRFEKSTVASVEEATAE